MYFGAGVVSSVVSDTEDESHWYADLDEFCEFQAPISFYEGPEGATWEPSTTMRNSVRIIERSLFSSILAAGGVRESAFAKIGFRSRLHEHRLQNDLRALQGRRSSPATLRKVQRVIEAYERPSSITNQVKKGRGDTCQLCGRRGFVKRDGTRYCEVHHLFHLSKAPPPECLTPEFIVVLCANCHRRMHYADVGEPVRVQDGWTMRVDDTEVIFVIPESEF